MYVNEGTRIGALSRIAAATAAAVTLVLTASSCSSGSGSPVPESSAAQPQVAPSMATTDTNPSPPATGTPDISPEKTSTANPANAPHIVVNQVRWPGTGGDLPSLVRSQGVVVVGEVAESQTVLLADPETGEKTDPYTISTIVVDRSASVSGEPIQGKIEVIQGGGLRGDTLFQDEGDPALQVGARYLLILVPPGEGKPYYTGLPFGRAEVTPAGAAKSVDPMWADSPLLTELEKVSQGSVEDALFAIAESVGLK